MPLNNPNNSNFGDIGVPMVWDTWAWLPLVGSPWVLKHLYCNPLITYTHPKGGKRALEKVEFPKIFKCHWTTYEQQQFRHFRGDYVHPHGWLSTHTVTI